MGIRNSQEVLTNLASDPVKNRLGKLFVFGRPAHVAAAIPGDEQACGCAVVCNCCGVDRHESAALAERSFRPAQEPDRVPVVKVVEHPECQD
jgi:hypothetical protein